MRVLKPFLRYYGGKYRAAPHYPAPRFSTIVEPFAGAAGYSLRYYDRNVILVEKYVVVAAIWRYLISVSAVEMRRIPAADCVDDLPSWVPQEARWLVGFRMNDGTVSPRRTLSSGKRMLRQMGRKYEGWCEATRDLLASQVDAIRHWRVIEGDYLDAPDVEATWFIDPPYMGTPYGRNPGARYVHSAVDYSELGRVCCQLQGQVIVCENEGATWLPFRPFKTLKAGVNGKGSHEVIWTND